MGKLIRLFRLTVSFFISRCILKTILRKIDSCYPVRLRKINALDGSIKLADSFYLSELLAAYRPMTVLEVGSFLGFSTRIMLETSKKWGAKITSVDPNVRHRIFDNPRSIMEKLNVGYLPHRLEIITGFLGPYNDGIYYDYEHYEPKREREYANSYVKSLPVIDRGWNRKFDFIFIDGDHSYSSVIKNFEICLDLLNRGGIIAFHDAVSWSDVNRALNDLEEKYAGKAHVKIFGAKRRYPFIKIDGIGFFQFIK
jgi:predicted O-methyltransferase YrrM